MSGQTWAQGFWKSGFWAKGFWAETVTNNEVVSGVKASKPKTIKLSELRELERESTAEFIKAHLKRQYDDVNLNVTAKGDSNVREKQTQASADERYAEEKRQAQILKARLNRNAILAIILASEL